MKEAGELMAPPADEPWDYSLRKYLLLLASLVATMTYSAAFTPPGGVWQDSTTDHLAGDPIIRNTHYARYAVFFYCNAGAFAASLLVVTLILLLAVLQEKKDLWIKLLPLRVVMVLGLLSLTMAYAAGTCRDAFAKLYSSSLLAASIAAYLLLQAVATVPPSSPPVLDGDSKDKKNDSDSKDNKNDSDGKSESVKGRTRKVLLLLATFAVSLTYSAGINTPGGFWDNDENNHHPGDAILKEHHQARLAAFFVCNTTAFVASLFITVLLLDRKLRRTGTVVCVLYGCIVAALLGLIGAYAAGSSRESATTTYVVSLVAAVLLCILLLLAVAKRFGSSCRSWPDMRPSCFKHPLTDREEQLNDAVDKARSLVLLLATLAATITYQAGLHPPGGVWQENKDGHIAGDPILLTTKPRRYKAFFYCNSVAFVASLVVIVLVQKKLLLRHHVLEAAMVLDLFSLIGAYAAGTCRDVSTSIYVIAMAGVVLVYVVIHVIFFTLEHGEDNKQVEKRRKRLLLFAILTATITYQAGLTPPSGFLLQDDESTGHQAGDPILLYNSVCRYTVFFYCNSASFMLSMALIILLVNPNMYKPAIRSYALSVCTAAGLFGLVGAYTAGSTQHRGTSISIIVMASVVLLVMVLLLTVSLVKGVENATGAKEVKITNETVTAATTTDAATAAAPKNIATDEDPEKKKHAKRKYLMLLGILVASVTYQVGLDQPGGLWQSNSYEHGAEHHAGNPVMQDNRELRYHVFFYCNSTAFVASIVIIILLLLRIGGLHKNDWWLRVMNTTVLLDLPALLGAYTVGSSRNKKTSAYVAMLIVAVLVYVGVHITLSFLCSLASSRNHQPQPESQSSSHQQGNGSEIP